MADTETRGVDGDHRQIRAIVPWKETKNAILVRKNVIERLTVVPVILIQILA